MFANNNSCDFFKLLNTELAKQDSLDENICLITLEKLTDNFITLECGHTFNYLPLYNEIVQQKTVYNSLETTILKLNEIKCPYCRTINNKLLPYIDISGVRLIKGVNYPKYYTIKLYNCEWIIKSGKNKNTACNCSAYKNNKDIFCSKHHILHNKTILEDSFIKQNNNLMKKYNITELKNILRSLNLKISGNKKELIKRLYDYGYIFND